MKTFLTILIVLFTVELTFSQWIQQSSPTKQNLYDIKFWENRGVIVGSKIILTSIDSGKTWSSQNFDYKFWRCSFQSKDSIWAVGGTSTNRNLILKSENSGLNWSIVDTSNKHSFCNAVFFSDNVHGWIGGGGLGLLDTTGWIDRTTDGGKTWQKIDSNLTYINDVYFLDTLNGWASSEYGDIYKTNNGGKSWNFNTYITLYGPTFGEPLRRIFFTTKDSGWTVGGIAGDQIIARTTDSGEKWNIYKDIYGSSLRGLWFTDSQNGFTVGGTNGGLRIIRTTDGGENWVLQKQPVTNFIFYFESIYMFNSNTGFIVADSGIILKTIDGGVLTGMENVSAFLPERIELFQNYPNPFNPSTVISYNLPSGSSVSLKIYDNLGRELETLVNKYQNAGLHSVTFDGKDLPSGIYFYKLQAGEFSKTKKLILLK